MREARWLADAAAVAEAVVQGEAVPVTERLSSAVTVPLAAVLPLLIGLWLCKALPPGVAVAEVLKHKEAVEEILARALAVEQRVDTKLTVLAPEALGMCVTLDVAVLLLVTVKERLEEALLVGAGV